MYFKICNLKKVKLIPWIMLSLDFTSFFFGLIQVEERRLTCLSQKPLPSSVWFLYSVGFAQSWNRDHCWSSVYVSDSKVCVPCHGSMDCTWSQMRTKLPVIRISWNCSDHVCRIDVFKCAHNESVWINRLYLSLVSLILFEFFLIPFSFLLCSFVTIFGDSLFKEFSNILALNTILQEV